MTRFSDAYNIQQGASNPSGIAHAIVRACAEIRDSDPGYTTDQIYTDPAVRLMVHQLASLCGIYELDDSMNKWKELYDYCKERQSADYDKSQIRSGEKNKERTNL